MDIVFLYFDVKMYCFSISQGSPPPSTVDPLDAYQEPSLADVLLVDRTTAQLVLPEGKYHKNC